MLLRPAPDLDVFVYTARDWRLSAAAITGRLPRTSPPVTPDTFEPAWLRGRDVLYFKLHGLPGEPRWYGMQRGVWQDALDVATVQAAAPLDGCIVVAQACWSEESPLIDAFLEAGAAAVVGADRALTAGVYWLHHSDWFGRYLLDELGRGRSVAAAARAASGRLRRRYPALDYHTITDIIGDPTRRITS